MLTRKIFSLFNKNICKYSSVSHSYKEITGNLSNFMSNKSYGEKTRNLLDSFIDNLSDKEKLMLQNPDYFKVYNMFTVEDLFNAKVHYGHKMTSLDDGMKPFIFGHRLGHVIFDLDKTAYFLRKALNFVAHIAYRKGIILFISQNPKMTLLVENTAESCKEYAFAREWYDGTLVSAPSLFKKIVRLPDVCIILNVKLENNVMHPAVIEAAKMCIPTVGILDSNANPNLITYPVPGNDDSYSAISLYCDLFKRAILRGKKEYEKDTVNEKKAVQSDKRETVQNEEKAVQSDKRETVQNEEKAVQSDKRETVQNEEKPVQSDEKKTVRNEEKAVQSDEGVILKSERKRKNKSNKKVMEIIEKL